MKNLEMFEMKKAKLSSIIGGGGDKTCDTSCDPGDGYEDGYYDANGNGQNDCGEKQYLEYESTC